MFGFALVLAFASVDAGDGKKDGKRIVGALAPHPLDRVFDKAKKDDDVFKAMRNDPLFQKAVKAALKAKADTEAALKTTPGLLSFTPSQAARQAFLETLKLDVKDD